MRQLGRYALHDEIASGGMATVYLARQHGEASFARVVAVKMLHAQYAKEEAFRAMFLDEARIVSRIRHPNVVATLDIVQHEGELFLVMEYVHGESLGRLLKSASASGTTMPIPIALAIAIDTLEGLHAAHEATSEDGTPLGIVHRDVSPQNLIVGVDGVTHIADFGIAKAVGRLAEKFSVHNSVKGKAGYMSPEQIRGKVDRRSDEFAMGVVLWEMLAMRRLFTGESFLEIVTKAMDAEIPPIETERADVGEALAAAIAKALARDPAQRFSTAREMAIALEQSGPRASAREVGAWMQTIAHETVARRAAAIARIESKQATEGPSAREDAPSELDTSVSGVAEGSATRSTKSKWGYAAVVAAVASLGAFALVRQYSRPHASTLVAPTSSVSTTVVTATTPSFTAVPPVTASATIASTATMTPPVARPVPRHVTVDAGPCHYEQLPDSQGILIPKKVCP